MGSWWVVGKGPVNRVGPKGQWERKKGRDSAVTFLLLLFSPRAECCRECGPDTSLSPSRRQGDGRRWCCRRGGGGEEAQTDRERERGNVLLVVQNLISVQWKRRGRAALLQRRGSSLRYQLQRSSGGQRMRLARSAASESKASEGKKKSGRESTAEGRLSLAVPISRAQWRLLREGGLVFRV